MGFVFSDVALMYETIKLYFCGTQEMLFQENTCMCSVTNDDLNPMGIRSVLSKTNTICFG